MKRALLIGVRDYRDLPTTFSTAVENDIARMRMFLAELGIEVAGTIGADGGPVERNTVKKAIARFILAADSGDDLVVYASGHGYHANGVSYLVPSDADLSLPEPEDYLVPIRFEAEINRTAARSLTVLFDACRNGADAERTALKRPSTGCVMTILFSVEPGERARTTPGPDNASVFTKALADIAPSLPVDARIDQAAAALQSRMNQISDEQGLTRQKLDVVTNDAPSAAPFPLFGTGPLINATDRWSRLLQRDSIAHVLSDCAGNWTASIDELLATIDRIDAAAPDLATGEYATVWAERGVGERALRALAKVVGLVFPAADINRLLIVGLVAAVDAGMRAAEADLLCTIATDRQLDRFTTIVNSDATLKAAISADADEKLASTLREWVVHVATPRTCVTTGNGGLHAKIAEVARAVVPTGDRAAHKGFTDYLMQCARKAFDTARSGIDLTDTYEPGVETRHLVEGAQISACLRLVWLLSLDSRMFPTEAGPHMAHDSLPVSMTLAGLERSQWALSGDVLDLSLETASPALDRTLRTLCLQLTDQMLADKQVGGPFHRLNAPVAATASRLKPERQSYRLPHVYFQVSVSEIQALLMGTNLYGDATLAIRELYQNAVDACNYRRQRMTHAAISQDESGWEPKIYFRMGEDQTGLYVECVDNGIGMSHYELRESFAKAGKRLRDLPEYTEEMSTWRATDTTAYHPISQFGIGVFSYFMIADELSMWTHQLSDSGKSSEPLHVRVKGGGGLFRVTPVKEPILPLGGTKVRLYLRPKFATLDLAKILADTIRVPSVETFATTADGTARHWVPETLYDKSGQEAPDAYRAGSGVYLHRGPGSLLLNGIPVKNGAPTYPGVTISVDGRARPDLAVDRTTLRGFDHEFVMSLLRAAAENTVHWSHISINWLIDLFRVDARAGSIAYRACRDRTMPLRHQKVDDFIFNLRRSFIEPLPDAYSIELTPARHGIYVNDAFLVVSKQDSVLDAARHRELRKIRRGSTSSRSAGLPKADEKLLSLLSSTDSPDDIPYNTARASDITIGDVAQISKALHIPVGLGAGSCYAWAVAFVDHPQPLWLTVARAQLYEGSENKQWQAELTRSSSIPILTRIWKVPEKTVPPVTGDWTHPIPYASDKSRPALRPGGSNLLPSTSEVSIEIEDLSPAARQALSRDRDSIAPYFTDKVPAWHVAYAARRHDVPPEAIAAELQTAGKSTLPEKTDLSRLMNLIERAPFILDSVTTFDKNGHAIFPSDLDDVVTLCDKLDTSQLHDLFVELAANGLLPPRKHSLADQNWRPRRNLIAHAKVLEQNFGKPMTMMNLIGLSAAGQCTYGEALEILHEYEPLFPGSTLPDKIPATLADQNCTSLESEYFLDSAWKGVQHTAGSWALRAVRQSAIAANPLPTIAATVEPLLSLMGYDSGLLRRIAAACPRPVEFDDLLVLGAGQLLDQRASAELVRVLCIPFVSNSDGLAERADCWLPFLAELQMRGTTWPDQDHRLFSLAEQS